MYILLLLLLCATFNGDHQPVPEAPSDTRPDAREANRASFHRKLSTLHWFDYTPSTFDPGSEDPVKRDDIVADLKALIDQGVSPSAAGLCAYSCSPKEGTDQIPGIARELGFSGMIVGIWQIDGESERDAIRGAAKAGLVDAVCVGNEGLESRYEWPELRQAMRDMRNDTNFPISTSEQIEDYGLANLTDPSEIDFIYPNAHPVFRGETDVEQAVRQVTRMVLAIRKQTTLPILIHETGWPSSGLRHHTPDNQRAFWSLMLRESKLKGYNLCIFELFSQPWKHEVHQGADVGASWGWFDADRKPKAVAELLREFKPHGLQEDDHPAGRRGQSP